MATHMRSFSPLFFARLTFDVCSARSHVRCDHGAWYAIGPCLCACNHTHAPHHAYQYRKLQCCWNGCCASTGSLLVRFVVCVSSEQSHTITRAPSRLRPRLRRHNPYSRAPMCIYDDLGQPHAHWHCCVRLAGSTMPSHDELKHKMGESCLCQAFSIDAAPSCPSCDVEPSVDS